MHPKEWVGIDDSLPILPMLGWLMPTEHKDVFEQRTIRGRVEVKRLGALEVLHRVEGCHHQFL